MTGLTIAILLMAALAYLFVRSQVLKTPAVLPRSQQIAAPPKAKPTPAVTPAPPAIAPPAPRQSTDQSSAEYVKTPLRPHPIAPREKARVVQPDGTTRLEDLPDQ